MKMKFNSPLGETESKTTKFIKPKNTNIFEKSVGVFVCVCDTRSHKNFRVHGLAHGLFVSKLSIRAYVCGEVVPSSGRSCTQPIVGLSVDRPKVQLGGRAHHRTPGRLARYATHTHKNTDIRDERTQDEGQNEKW